MLLHFPSNTCFCSSSVSQQHTHICTYTYFYLLYTGRDVMKGWLQTAHQDTVLCYSGEERLTYCFLADKTSCLGIEGTLAMW